MRVTPAQETIAKNIVTIHETGRLNNKSYGAVVNAAGDLGGLTYGKHQVTINSGNLYFMLVRYVNSPGAQWASRISPYLERLRKKDATLANNQDFITTLRSAGNDPIMITVQDRYFDEQFWIPAQKFCDSKGFIMPLTLAIVYDSVIHGSLYRIDKMLPPNLPERQWEASYVATRRSWLANHANTLLRRTTYRMDTFQRLIDAGNFNLNPPVWAHGQRADAGVNGANPAPTNHPQPVGPASTQSTLDLGDRGEEVKLLQNMLITAGWKQVIKVADGIFGKDTDTAVKEVQRLYGLTVDGIVGPATWRILEQIA